MSFAAALLTFTLAATDARQSVRCVELNPIMRPFVDHPVALYGVKLGGAALTTWCVHDLWKSGRKKTAVLMWLGVNTAQAIVIAHNARTK